MTGLKACTTGSAVGTNCLYQVVPNSNWLSVLEFTNQRVGFDSKAITPVTFIECHNLHNVKALGAGKAIAIHHQGENKAKLGFVMSIEVLSHKVTVFYQCWTGRTNDAGVPLICFLPENGRWEGSYQCHFVPESSTFRFDSKRADWPIVKFLNQVCGPRLGGSSQRALADGLQNRGDECIQCSSQGPDDFLPFRLPSDDRPIASLSSEPIRAFPRKDLTLQENEFAPKVCLKPGKNKRKKQHASFSPFAKPGYKSYDAGPQPVIFTEPPRNNNTGLFAVPYLKRSRPGSRNVFFGLLDKAQLQELFRFSDTLSPLEHDKKVEELQTKEMELHCLDLQDHRAGVRFCTVDDTNFPKLSDLPSVEFLPPSPGMAGRGCYMLKDFTGGNEQLPLEAVMVSRWVRWPYQPQEVCAETADLFASAYKGGSGSRSCTKVLGLNVYQGKHQGERAIPDLTRGPGEAVNHQYYRQEYTDLLLPVCETILSRLTREAKNIARCLDPILYRLLMMTQENHRVLGVCRRKIITMGMLSSCLGFANTPHTDHYDFYRPGDQEEFLKCFRSFLEGSHHRNKICAQYLQRWVDQYGGFCRPTTCGYTFSGALKGDNSKVEIFQYFILEGLGFAVRFMSETVHHFYGNIFTHNTAVCVAVGSDGTVSYKSDPSYCESFRVFAWGGS
jgi:hypothetical protein